MLLEKRIQARANSLNDGGRTVGDAFRVEITVRSRFVPRLRGGFQMVIAGLLAIGLMVGVSVELKLPTGRLVSPTSNACAQRQAEEADYGSVLSSSDAGYSEPTSRAPRELCSGTWGRMV